MEKSSSAPGWAEKNTKVPPLPSGVQTLTTWKSTSPFPVPPSRTLPPNKSAREEFRSTKTTEAGHKKNALEGHTAEEPSHSYSCQVPFPATKSLSP